MTDSKASQPDRPDWLKKKKTAGRSGQTEKPDRTSPASPDEDRLTDRVLGEFRLLKQLGRGGMAEVYLAEQTSLKRRVAVKIMRPKQTADADEVLLKRFELEAKAAAGLNHPNIVQVYMVGEEHGLHYIAQEYVDGLNLKDFVKKKGAPPLALALRIMRQVAAALQAAAQAGIVHRDIKPENILITRKGEAKVADFGLAQLTGPDRQLNLTKEHTTLGTPLYMSPEQVNGKTLDARSDIYSFGVTCYHMLAGRPPFQGETAVSVAAKHLHEEPPPLASACPGLPPALCQMIHRMMAKDPQARYADSQAIVQDLKKIAKALREGGAADVSVSTIDAGPAAPGRFGRLIGWGTRRPIASLILCSVLLGVPAAAIGWWLRPGNPLKTPAPSRSNVSVLDTAANQYNSALLFQPGREAAWRAVIQNFPNPDEARYRHLAMEHLALLHLNEGRFDQALNLFDELAALGNAEFKAKATAGRAIVACLKGDFDLSRRLITLDLQNKLDEESEIRQLIEECKQRNSAARGRSGS